MKVCIKCGVEKDLEGFYFRYKLGKHYNTCKDCAKAETKARKDADPEGVKAYNEAYSAKNRERLNEAGREYNKRNADKIKESRAARYVENSEQIKESVYAYRKQNPHMVTKWNAARRARVRDLTPDLTTEQQEQIDYLYWLAKDLRAVSGEEYHVDHIFPLARGGLHEPSNLQILPKDLNLQKSTKVDF